MNDLTTYLAMALHLLAEHCRREGLPMPPELDRLRVVLSASKGQPVPEFALLGRVVEPLCVDYSSVAARLGVSERTVKRLTSSGRLPAVRIGGRALVRVADLEAFVEQLEVSGGA